MNKKDIRNLGLFISIVIISGWLGVLLDSVLTEQPEGDSLGMGVWLVLPMLTALVIILISRFSWKELGLKPNFKGNIKWYLASILIFPVVTAIVMLIGAATNWIDLSAFALRPFIVAFGSTMFVNFIIDIFEETAWRGYLTSQLLKLNLNDWKLYLIVGCVWAAWHIPYYLVFLPEADIQAVMPVSRAIYVVVAFTTFLCWTVMFTELFRVTKSVWPCVILHTVEDSLINLLVISGYISIAVGKEILVSPINGIIASILYLAVGLGIRAYRIKAYGMRTDQILISKAEECSG
ncbi:MAG: CPBP family intramembrane metalloprotease [Syntrophomonas sp.]|uniref:CPBP family intramembrane glutamic endopeptidase n=1 Tax=Syntrophomonas sp. TaxID=2053627 RepID=UPI0026360E2C|nr:CPBP family intramembrane glutamic endopeptidase [Syntrophomonas sp.]MDD4627154.1 CPBP family intramembrane metalloprotease [Syntrophomonas sp.]